MKKRVSSEEETSLLRYIPAKRLEISVLQTISIQSSKRRLPSLSASSNLQRQVLWHSEIVQEDERSPGQLEVKVQSTVSITSNGSVFVFLPSVKSDPHRKERKYTKNRDSIDLTAAKPTIPEHKPRPSYRRPLRPIVPADVQEGEPVNRTPMSRKNDGQMQYARKQSINDVSFPDLTNLATDRKSRSLKPHHINLVEAKPSPISPRVRDRTIQVKVYYLRERCSTVAVSPNERVSILSHVLGYSVEEMRLSYNHCELDPDLTFAFQRVFDGGEIYIEEVLTLRCKTAHGTVTLLETSTTPIARVKMDAIVAAGLDVKGNYELMLNRTVLADDSTVLSAGLGSSSLLQLRSTVTANTELSKSQALLQFAFSSVVPGSNIIVTKVPVAQLVQQGFRRNILDPIMYYKMTLIYGRAAEDVKTENNKITVNVEVVSWGSLTLSIDPRRTVHYMKQQLAAKIKIPESNQSIIFNGQLLQDSSTLQSCGLADGYSVTLTCTGANTYLFLPLEYFDSAGDFDYTGYTSPPDFGNRGGQEYFPPCGWYRYGLKVTGKFENDIWLGQCNGPREWIVSYHGTRVEAMQSIAITGYDISKGKAFVYGYGVYSAPHVEDAEWYATPFVWEGKSYKLVFMNRVNPAPGALKKTKDMDPSYPNYYVSTTDRDIRPYGILLKST